LLNEPTAGGVVFWRLFWRKKASPPRLCGHHYNKPLDRVVTVLSAIAPLRWVE